jgi:16S rRNA (uracil1498-N3)-methyltransferase
MADRPATRLYIPAGLAAGGAVELDRTQTHRLRDVLRLGPGALVAVFNPRDGEWLCRIAELNRSRAMLEVVEQRRPPACDADLWLLFAPIRRARLDWLVEKASELGAARLLPVTTARTQPAQINRERLTALAIAAAEQAERLSVPEIAELAPLTRLLAEWPSERHLVVCDESGGGRPIAEALAGFPADAPAALLVGPEGGFTDTELDALGKLPIVIRVGLGPLVLRAETGVLAALAVFQAIAGDWHRHRQR